MALGRKERILILAKTYPSPSVQYVETSCVAGVSQDGAMRRLYPVPFRMIEKGQQFKKWQWIDVRVEKANKDHRPESHKLYVDTIVCGDKISTDKEWQARWEWLDKIPAFGSIDAMEAGRLSDGLSMALLRPKRLLGLDITKARNPDWTEDEKEKLTHQQTQDDLFSKAEVKRQIRDLRKVPFDFHYRYVCDTPECEKEYRHKIIDWEPAHYFGTAAAAMAWIGSSRSEPSWRAGSAART
ncbi:MAG: hypothetical protein ACRYG5_04990 [Janthinobacterium lividum]